MNWISYPIEVVRDEEGWAIDMMLWWESVKDLDCWSGAIVGMSFEDAMSISGDELRAVYERS